nr:Succinyldiaminopimelate desuccinylase [uncultured bacterium]
MNPTPAGPDSGPPGEPLPLAQALIRAPSVTPVDAGCQEILAARLARLGFTPHRLRFGPVQNLYARLGEASPNLCLAGHTDVVPPGQEDLWRSPPFAGEVHEGFLTGRGACDMKGGLAAMVAGVERFLAERPGFAAEGVGSLSFLITGDEEGEAVHGTREVLSWLEERGESLDHCLVGEPTGITDAGDCLKNGRRGSVNGWITVRGVPGHVAYPHQTRNPIHAALAALDALQRHPLDQGNADFEPSGFQWTSLAAGGEAVNVTPLELTARFNIRFNTEQTPEGLERHVRDHLQPLLDAGFGVDLTMRVSGLPFRTRPGAFLDRVRQAIREVTGREAALSTSGGTSDARFIAQVCPETLELGLPAVGMHQLDEGCRVSDLEALAGIQHRLLGMLFPRGDRL